MTNSLTSAGYIVTDKAHSAIHGFGATADEAWADMISGLSNAGVTVIGDIYDADISVEWPEQTPANNYEISAATKGLLDAVATQGGNIAWRRRGAVSCLPDEQ